MAATETQQLSFNTVSSNAGTQMTDSTSKRGGWIAFLFIAGTLVGSTLAASGWGTNLIVFLMEYFHVKSIDATQIFNIVNGCISVLPVVAAIVADSFLGCYSVISIFSLISLLGIILITLTTMIHSLRPQPCEDGSSLCTTPSKVQFAVLYLGIALASIGLGGTRFTIAAMGANQFDNAKHQGIFFNWYVIILYASAILGATVIVYVEDNVSWALGFGLCVVVNTVGLAIFLLGNGCYRHVKPQGSPFTSLARVVIAAIHKRKVPVSFRAEDYYHGKSEMVSSAPTKSFRFLNHGALKTAGDTKSDGSIAESWRLCSVQQVEDLKTLLKIVPVLSSGILLSIPIAVLGSLTLLQALTMDRHLGPHFKIPAASLAVFALFSTAVSLALIDRILYPMWQKMTHGSPTPLQRVGLGHMFNVMGLAVAALVESERLKIARTHHLLNQPGSIVPLSVLWIVPQVAVVGIGEAFHYPGQVTLFYQEFPKSLRSTATAMIAMIMGIAYYLSTAAVDLVHRVTTWLPDNINNGRLDNVYWMLAVVGVLNFGYFLICAKFYKYQNVERGIDNHESVQRD